MALTKYILVAFLVMLGADCIRNLVAFIRATRS